MDHAIRARLEAVDRPVPQGARHALELAVTNPGPHVVVLDEARGDGPHDEVVRWRRHPDGVVVYDAGHDEYHHHSGVTARALLPLCNGIIAPGLTLRTLMSLKSLETGPRRARVTVTGHALPVDEVPRRVYVTPEQLAGPITVYRAAADVAQAHGVVVARWGGCARVEAAAETPLEVVPDAEAPPAPALTRAGPGAALVDRLRRLGGAWVARAQDGAFVVAQGDRVVRCAAGVVDPALWARLDEGTPWQPVTVLFRSDRARALRDAGTLPLGGLDTIQQVLPPAAILDLLAACDERGLAVRWGQHSPTASGLIVT